MISNTKESSVCFLFRRISLAISISTSVVLFYFPRWGNESFSTAARRITRTWFFSLFLFRSFFLVLSLSHSFTLVLPFSFFLSLSTRERERESCIFFFITIRRKCMCSKFTKWIHAYLNGFGQKFKLYLNALDSKRQWYGIFLPFLMKMYMKIYE